MQQFSLESIKIYTNPYVFLTENTCIFQIVGTSLLLCLIGALTDEKNNSPPKNIFPITIGQLIISIGSSFGYNCGYPLNPARDLGPRIFTAIAGWGKEPFRWAVLKHKNFSMHKNRNITLAGKRPVFFLSTATETGGGFPSLALTWEELWAFGPTWFSSGHTGTNENERRTIPCQSLNRRIVVGAQPRILKVPLRRVQFKYAQMARSCSFQMAERKRRTIIGRRGSLGSAVSSEPVWRLQETPPQKALSVLVMRPTNYYQFPLSKILLARVFFFFFFFFWLEGECWPFVTRRQGCLLSPQSILASSWQTASIPPLTKKK